MKLPGGERAIIPEGKIERYCLDIGHDTGRNKARVFASALGITLRDAAFLKQALLAAARDGEAVPVGSTAFGILYRVRFVLEFGGRSAIVRSGWILGPDGNVRLTTALVE